MNQLYTYSKKIGVVLCFLTLFGITSIAQNNSKDIHEISFDDFLTHVLAHNLDYMLVNYDVSIAEAAVTASRVFEDPELTFMLPMFNDDDFSGFPRNIEFEIEIPIELFGKRRNRIRAARAEHRAAEAELADFLRNLRSEAALVYVSALLQQNIIDRLHVDLEQLNSLLSANKVLFEVGEIGEIDVLQTRLEVRNFEAELYDAKAEFSEILSNVYVFMGGIPQDSLLFFSDFAVETPIIDFATLQKNVLQQRADIRAAEFEIEAAEYALRLARSERLPDITIIGGYHNEDAQKNIRGTQMMYAGLAIPLQFSGFNKGNFLEHSYMLEQTKIGLSSIKLEAEKELLNAWETFSIYSKKKLLYTDDILSDAERVRDAILYSYQRGEVSLLELLEAQRTMNEVYINYYETLSLFTNSIITLSQVSGEWFLRGL